jgi:transposase
MSLLESLQAGADSWGFPTPDWNCPRVQLLISRLFHVSYNVDYVGTLLHQLGWSVQKLAYRAREQDARAIERWRREEWPRLKKEDRTPS